MTESEAIEKLKNMRLFMQITDKNSEHKFAEDDYKANEMAIQLTKWLYSALEKQVPKKVRVIIMKEEGDRKYHYCAVCGRHLMSMTSFCPDCGQKLDWRKLDWSDK